MTVETEYRLAKAIQDAVEAADRIVLASSDGSNEETNYMTAELARRFVSKALGHTWTDLLRKEQIDKGER